MTSLTVVSCAPAMGTYSWLKTPGGGVDSGIDPMVIAGDK